MAWYDKQLTAESWDVYNEFVSAQGVRISCGIDVSRTVIDNGNKVSLNAVGGVFRIRAKFSQNTNIWNVLLHIDTERYNRTNVAMSNDGGMAFEWVVDYDERFDGKTFIIHFDYDYGGPDHQYWGTHGTPVFKTMSESELQNFSAPSFTGAVTIPYGNGSVEAVVLGRSQFNAVFTDIETDDSRGLNLAAKYSVSGIDFDTGETVEYYSYISGDITGDNKDVTRVIGAVNSAVFMLTVTDDLGLSTVQTFSFSNAVKYVPVSIDTIDIARYAMIDPDEVGDEPTYVQAQDGNRIWFGLTTGGTDLLGVSGYTRTVKIEYSTEEGIQHTPISLYYTNDWPYSIGNTEAGRSVIDGNFSAAYDYDFVVTVQDNYGSVRRQVFIEKAVTDFNLGEYGVAIGKFSEGKASEPLFEVAHNSLFYGELYRIVGGVGGVRVPINGIQYDIGDNVGAEQEVSGLWLDGRKIYRRFIAMEAHASGTQTQSVADISSFGNNLIVVNLRGMVYSGPDYTGNAYPLPYAHYTAAQEVALYVEDNYIKTYAYGSTRTWASGWVMIEYVRDEGVIKRKFPTSPATGVSAQFTASSEYSGGYAAWKAFDDSISTSWSSKVGENVGAWIELDTYDDLRDIDVHVYGRKHDNVAYPKSGVIELSNNREEWVTGGTFSGWKQTTAGGLLGIVKCDMVPSTSRYRYVRLRVTEVGGSFSYIAIGYIKVYGYPTE